MKEKIIARLKEKFAGVNLSKERLNAIADKLAKKVEKDEDLDQAIDDANELMDFAAIAKGDDKIRTLEAEAKKKSQPANDPDPSKKDDPKPADEVPSWAKAILESNKKLETEIGNLKAGKTTDLRKQTLEQKLKDVNPKLKETIIKNFNRMKFETDDEFEEFVSETEKDLGEFSQDITGNTIDLIGKPNLGNGGKVSEKQTVAAIENWAKQNAPKPAATPAS